MKKLFLSLALVSAVALPLGVSAQSVSLVAQIQSLLKQVAALQAKIESLVPQKSTARVWCDTLYKDFGIGDQGPAVFGMAISLSKEHLGTALEEGQNEFDGLVFETVQAFQKKYGLPQTGFVGPLTRAKLNSLYYCQPSVKK